MLNEFDIAKVGWPVALPRFSRRPSDKTMTERAAPAAEAGNFHSWTLALSRSPSAKSQRLLTSGPGVGGNQCCDFTLARNRPSAGKRMERPTKAVCRPLR